MNFNAEDLTPAHLGQSVTVEECGTRITGMLVGIHAALDVITEYRIMQEAPEYMPGRTTLELVILPDHRVVVSRKTEVEVHEDN